MTLSEIIAINPTVYSGQKLSDDKDYIELNGGLTLIKLIIDNKGDKG